MPRKRSKRKRQLLDQRMRAQRRQQYQFTAAKFSVGHYLKDHLLELTIVVFAAACVIGIYFLGPDREAMRAMSEAIGSQMAERPQQWGKEYPLGFKVIALTETEIIPTGFDTLPKDFHVNWSGLSVARVQSVEYATSIEKIKMTIPGIRYPPQGVNGLDVSISFVWEKGARAHVADLGDRELVIEVVEGDTGQLFCLFGLRY